MKLPRIDIDDGALARLALRYKISELSLFGSILRDDFDDRSDIDILVKFQDEAKYSLFDLFEIIEQFESVLGRTVDLVEKDGLRNPFRKEEILRTARIVYAA